MFRGPSFIVSTMQEETTPIFKRLWYDWTQQQPGIEPTNPLGQCWVPPIVAFYDQQGLLRTYSLPGGSIRSTHPGSPRQLGLFSRRKQVWTYSVLVENKFGLFDRIYEMRCPFVAVGLNARFIVLPHWDNMSQAHMLTHPVTLYWHWADQFCFVVPTSSWVPCKQGPRHSGKSSMMSWPDVELILPTKI